LALKLNLSITLKNCHQTYYYIYYCFAQLNFFFCQEIIDFVATEIANFVSAHALAENEEDAPTKKKKLGFTLSYPIDKSMPFTTTTFQQKNTNDPVELVASSGLSIFLMFIFNPLVFKKMNSDNSEYIRTKNK
jgi:hypothetical protein